MLDRCTCHQPIDVEPYFGMELGGDHDPDTLLTFHPEHIRCLQEWGLALDFDSPLGIAHVHWEDDA